MKTKDMLKRSYYALASIAFFIVLLTFSTASFLETVSRNFFYWDIGISGVIFTLTVSVYCWIMSRHNWRNSWKWWAGTIPIILLVLRFVGIKILMSVARNNQEFININILNHIFFGVLILYAAVITFCSKTKYDYRHIQPVQTKVETRLFKWLPIIAQIVLWICLIYSLRDFIYSWIEWWPTEEWASEEFNHLQNKFEQYGL